MGSLEICLGKNKKRRFKQQEKLKSFKLKLTFTKKKRQKQRLIWKIKLNKLKNFKNR
jgi:hypothetical protein